MVFIWVGWLAYLATMFLWTISFCSRAHSNALACPYSSSHVQTNLMCILSPLSSSPLLTAFLFFGGMVLCLIVARDSHSPLGGGGNVLMELEKLLD
jgi:hypothetical protein